MSDTEQPPFNPPLSVCMRAFDEDGDILPVGLVLMAEALEAENARLRKVYEAAERFCATLVAPKTVLPFGEPARRAQALLNAIREARQ